MLLARQDADVEDFSLTRDGATALVVWNASGRNELDVLDLDSGERTQGPELPAEILWEIELSRYARGVRPGV